MRHTPHYLMTEPDEVKRLVRNHPWATFVSATSRGLVASHYPAILDPTEQDRIVLLSHFGRPDEQLHELGQHEVLVIVQGPHDYVSSSWYAEGDIIPTWNHVTAHLYGVPEILSEEENYQVLRHLTDHFEAGRPGAHSLDEDEAGTRRVAKGTVGLRLAVTRFDARAKLSQNKSREVVETVVQELARTNQALADEMRRVHGSVG
jgi:transcriptional regulator